MPDLSLDTTIIEAPDGPFVIVAAGSQDNERVAAPHRHAHGELLGSLRGLLSVGLEEDVRITPAIHATWIPPGHVHSARSHGPFEGWIALVAKSACVDLPARPRTIRVSGLLREAVMRAAQWTHAPLDEPSARIAAVILDEIRSLPIDPFGLPLPREPRLVRIARALLEDPADTRGAQDWADWAALSSRTLSRRFVAETGFTFTAWRQRARLMRSLEMLAADIPVNTIALELGYSTASAFISLFRRTFGETPAAYRQRL